MSDAPPELPGLTYVARVGRGGYADVYAYEQALPRRRVAVKVLHDPAAASAFVAEADALARLEHPHIVPVHAAGVAPDGRGYLVMPLVRGPSLHELCRTAPVDVGTVLRVGVQLAGAVESAHRHGLLHRDLKPGNVLLNAHGAPVLVDFGLAGRAADAEGADLGVSVPWAAPEVLFGQAPASAASDVYSLGATLWTLLAGRAPDELPDGERDSVAAMLRRIRARAAGAPPCPGAPPELDAVLRRALATDPAARPASALELAGLLAGVQRALGEPVTSPVVSRPADPAPARAARLLDASPASALATARAWAPPPAPPAPPAPPPRAEPPAAPPKKRAEPPAARPEPAATAAGASGEGARAPAARRPGRWTVGRPGWLLAGVLLAAAAGAWWWGAGPGAGAAPALAASRTGQRVVFSWTHPDPRAGDSFAVKVAGRVVPRAEATLVLDAAGPACARVRVLDRSGAARGPFSERVCA